jgi:electron transport complex protein RnfC
MRFYRAVWGDKEMVSLEPRRSEEILQEVDRGKRIFFLGCSGWKGICNPGGESQLQTMKKDLELLGQTFSGTLIVDALCNKGLDEIALLGRLRQIRQADILLVLSCQVGVQAVTAVSPKTIIPALRTRSAVEWFEGILEEGKLCRLCGDCFVELAGGLCPLYFCPKGLLNGPCQGAYQGRCEVDLQRVCGWERIYERLKARGRLDALKNFVKPKDHSEVLPLIRLHSALLAEMAREGASSVPQERERR